MDKIAQFKTELVSTHELFNALKVGSPQWWQHILNYGANNSTDNIYIDIRKDNTINIYYQGASLAKIKWKKGEVVATTHPKYLGYYDKTDKHYYKKNGDAIYQQCEGELQILGAEDCHLLNNAQQYYTNKNGKADSNSEDTPEKKLQGEIVCQNKMLYIDSEFAHRYKEGTRRTIRIDLVRVLDNKIQFVELKRIQDSKLLNNDNSKPEVVIQMEEYKNFISKNSAALLDYYKTVIEIKRSLNIPTTNANIDLLEIDTEPYLEIYDLYINVSTQRKERIKRIEEQLRKYDIQYSIK